MNGRESVPFRVVTADGETIDLSYSSPRSAAEQEWQFYYSSAAGNADLGKLQAQFDEYFDVLRANGVRVHSVEAPVPRSASTATGRRRSRRFSCPST